jgi:hypothetical protein
MTESSIINENDVLCGRGGLTNTHVGNKRFRSIVAEYQEEYLQARKKEKALIATKVVERIRKSGGRFLKRDVNSDLWVEVPDKKAMGKTGQALREGLDVRHKTIRPEKSPRRLSDSSSGSPRRKRARVVQGNVIQSPGISYVPTEQSIPDLNEEHHNLDQIYLCLPAAITGDSCDSVEEV